MGAIENEERLLAWVKAVAVPLAVLAGTVFVGIWTTSQQQRSEDRRVEALYVELAIDLLATEQPPGADEATIDRLIPLRRWAFELLSEASPTDIPDELRAQFVDDATTPLFPTFVAPCLFDTDGDGTLDSAFGLGTDGRFSSRPCRPRPATNSFRPFCNVDTDDDGVDDVFESDDDRTDECWPPLVLP